jgi:lysophospholipase L1-like esterase
MFKKAMRYAAVLTLAVALTGCGSESNTSDTSTTPTTAATDAANGADDSTTTDAEVTPEAEETVERFYHDGVIPSERLSDELVEQVTAFDTADTSALSAVMKKAESGEPVTIVAIGGSITAGTVSKGSQDDKLSDKYSYAKYVESWWKESFDNVTFVNAGIGATNSYLGVHRAATDVLAYEPDLVIVEFAVNDAGVSGIDTAYDDLVRNILKSDSQPAVMLLFMAQTNGSTNQSMEKAIGEAYNLPMISYADLISTLMNDGTYTADDLSGDTVHPSALGHSLAGELFTKYFNDIYANIDSAEEPTEFTADPVTEDKYLNATILDSTNITPDSTGTFTEGSSQYYIYPDGWTNTEGDGELTFTVTCQNLGLIYYKTTDGLSGEFDVLVDGEVVTTLNADYTNGWGDYAETTEVYTSDETAEHTVEIKKSENSEADGFAVLGLLVSGE